MIIYEAIKQSFCDWQLCGRSLFRTVFLLPVTFPEFNNKRSFHSEFSFDSNNLFPLENQDFPFLGQSLNRLQKSNFVV